MVRKPASFVLVLLLLAVAAGPVRAQSNPIFLAHGRIEFMRSVNVYAQLTSVQDGDDQWTDLIKKMSNHFRTSYFDLYFTGNRSLYKPGRESDDKQTAFFWQPPAQDNVVWSDLVNGKGVSRKNVFEQAFLVQDSLRRIKWKITDETRNIVGFNCRRANAIIMDSIYVVAFYTDEILAEGGPESFTGLPGMILGVSLPHEHVSWFATKVEAVAVTEAQVEAPLKGKKVNTAGLLQSIQGSLKDWGKTGRQYMEAIVL
ncbi:GLPGLI family protein [Puia sp.]|jgi:GLPGLI family protein|uniref:GLPGLI family protein n=1 Tax=Puia sp. TaxID=2045100 RepID=UPI002F3EE529